MNHNGNQAAATRNPEKKIPGTERAEPFLSEIEPVYPSRQATRKSGQRPDLRLIVIGAGIVLVVLLLVFSGISRRGGSRKKPSVVNGNRSTLSQPGGDTQNAPSLTPILDFSAERESAFKERIPEEIKGTAAPHRTLNTPSRIGDIALFDGVQPWEAPPYHPSAQTAASGGQVPQVRNEAEKTLDKVSLVYVTSSPDVQTRADNFSSTDLGISLKPGMRLRARLESAVSTAVRTPVVAVIEYNYVQEGQMAIPAGAKAIGQLETADRSGYVDIRFNSLFMPDGRVLSFDAVATDLQLRPLRGRVEGKHASRNAVVRSLAGIGEMAAMFVGRSSLNQPLSEGDLLRERVSNNVGQVSDQELTRLSVSQQIVVSIPAETEINIVLQKPTPSNPLNRPPVSQTPRADEANLDQLRQLLQLQRELNQTDGKSSPE